MQALIRVPGWYPDDSYKAPRKDSGGLPASDRIRLGQAYTHSIRRHDPYDLEITEVKKYAGKYFNPVVVREVIDLGQNSRFYIDDNFTGELQEIIGRNRNNEIVIGQRRRN